ncbi:calmodulin-binding protein 60 A-like [Papaver somniferum]|uniref:calmodulin-binding protein 60 A-like n=1 Tax=Papaver somniferum TaxID=3469 RepID=UPI000E70326A|nr:calmodulin-binding protein 60 A-like [Papaver somniferum]
MVTKRHYDEESDDDARESKRPHNTLESALRGELVVEEFVGALVNCFRKVLREELDCRFPSCSLSSQRPPVNQIQASRPRGFRLQFVNNLPKLHFTGARVLADGSVPLQVVILDGDLNVVRTGPLSSLKIEIFALDGDFGTDEQEDWSEKQFDESIKRAREGKRPLVIGEVCVNLVNGSGLLSDITVTDNSSWVRSGKFRLGARVVQPFNTDRIREARTGSFVVRDHRGQGYQKHFPPWPCDEVWRLKKIRKDGVFHQRLADMGILTVENFLRLFFTDSSALLKAFDNGTASKTWEAIIRHAKTCPPDNRTFVHAAGQECRLFFNSFYDLTGASFDGGRSYIPLANIPPSQMILVEAMKRYAYDHQNEIVEIDWMRAHVHPIALPIESAANPEPALDLLLPNFQTTNQVQPVTRLGLAYEDHCQHKDVTIAAPGHHRTTECVTIHSNNFMTGESSGHAVTNEHFAGDFNFSHVQTPMCFPNTWDHGMDIGYDYLSYMPDATLNINRNSSRIGWFKIKAFVRFLCQKKNKSLYTPSLHCSSSAARILNL